MAVRLVATDLDGTLLGEGFSVSPRNVAALRRVQDDGIVVVLVTARNWRSVVGIAAEAGVTGHVICSNGAVVYDLEERRVHRASTADRAALDRFMAACLSVEGCCFGWETPLGAFRSPLYHELAQRDSGFSTAYLDAVEVVDAVADDHEVTKLVVRHPTLRSDELLEALAPFAEGVSVTISGGAFVEVSAAGVTKAHALEGLCADLGIAADEVIAFGDMPNDLPMLQWAGRGVAMANGHPTVLAAVPEHTASHLDDGVALVLEAL